MTGTTVELKLSTCSNKKNLEEGGKGTNISQFRVALPQILASTAKNLLLLDLGMTLAFPTIVIPVLLEGRDSLGLTFDTVQASWFGSISFICQPLGSVLSGIILEPLGRKYSMMVVNVPHFIAWILFYFASTQAALYAAAVIIGFGVGFMEAPIITYVGEIAEPRLRGTLTSYSNLFATFGMVFLYFLGTQFNWRTVALVSTLVPVVTIIAISQVPETPLWLLSKGRKEDAEKSLCWLRGWVEPNQVASEFNDLVRYSEATKSQHVYENKFDLNDENTPPPPYCLSTESGPPKEPRKRSVEINVEEGKWSFVETVKDFLRPQMMKPLFLIICFFFFSNFTGSTATRPYMVKVFERLNFPVEPYTSTVIVGSVGFLGSILCMCTVAKFGKRPIALFSLATCCLGALGVGMISPRYPWLLFLSYMVNIFASYYGVGGLVWTLVSEVFPFRGRSFASGLSAASSYILSFVATKTFLSLENQLGLDGTFVLYSAISAVGFVFIYFMLPETEGHSLEDIETNYSNSKRLGR